MTTEPKPRGRSRKLWIAIGIVAIIVIVGATVGVLLSRAGTAPPAPTGPNVTIWDGLFCSNSGNCDYSPTSKEASSGTTITWTNTGSKPHTVTECTTSDSSASCPNGVGANTSNVRAFDSNTQFASGLTTNQQFQFTFNLAAGTYYYYCTLHLWMHGAVVVS